MNPEERTELKNSITERLSKLESGELDLNGRRNLRKEIALDLARLGEEKEAEAPTPVYDKLKNGDYLDLPADEFIDKLKEAAKELGEEETLTERIIEPANKWKEKREQVAVEGVEDVDCVDAFLKGEMPSPEKEADPDEEEPELEPATEGTSPSSDEELSELEPATEDVKTKLSIGDKFRLKGKVSRISEESTAKKSRKDNKTINIEFPFNHDWGNYRVSVYFERKDDSEIPFKIDDEITLEAEIVQAKVRKPKSDTAAPAVYYGIHFEAPEGFVKHQKDYCDFVSESAILKNMTDHEPAVESADPDNGQSDQENPQVEPEEEPEKDPATEIKMSPGEHEADSSGLDNEETEELATESTVSERGLAFDASDEKDDALWERSKKIALESVCGVSPTGDNEKDNEALTESEAWGFALDRYEKLEVAKTATESAEELEESPAVESSGEEEQEKPEVVPEIETDDETLVAGEELENPEEELEEDPALESVDEEVFDEEEYIIGG